MPGFGVITSETDLYLDKVRKRLEALRPLVYAESLPVEDLGWRITKKREKVAAAMRARYRRVRPPLEWGREPETAWLRLRFRIPRAWRGSRVELRLRVEGEGVVFHRGGPLQGLDDNRDEVLLARRCRGGERYDLFLEAGSAGRSGRLEPRCFRYAELVRVSEPVRDAYYDCDALCQLACVLSATSARRGRVIAALNDVFNDCPLSGGEDELSRWARSARKRLAPVLAAGNAPGAQEIWLAGHSHIDVAWKWTLAETIRKCSRTFSTALKYLEMYPHYTFSQSQPQLYEYTRKHYPGLYRRVKGAIRSGRWEAVGAMWVEPDCNITGGEGMIRQILHGRRYWREEFGVDSNVAWLPDAFGFAGNLPQIFAKAGLKYFHTNKLNISMRNWFPFASFWWKGIDGSRVLAHLGSKTEPFCPSCSARELRDEARVLAARDQVGRPGLLPYGWGDGGGGADREMIEFAARCGDLQGLPKTRACRVDEFFRMLERNSSDLPTWTGELYYEEHRGTYTSQAKTKLQNRKSELGLRESEILASLAHAAGAKYPEEKLDRAWKLTLLNHFHDILPGSSIKEVYEDSDRQYAEVLATTEKITGAGLRSLAARLDRSGPGRPLVVFNPLGWARGGVVEIDAPKGPVAVESESGEELPVQRVGKRLLVAARELPSMGAAVWRAFKRRPRRRGGTLKVSTRLLENDLVRVRLDARGLLSSVFDKRSGRELLPRGERANVLQLFEDRPTGADAWNIDHGTLECAEEITALESARVVERGPVRVAVRLVRRFGKSRVEQDLRLAAGSAAVEFATRVSWRESEKLLKAAFPLDVHSERFSSEIQFGAVERPTTRNTSWERAKFEVCAHRWTDLSEPDFGASLLNDCKYGCDCDGNVLRITLLKAASNPDPTADRGEHEFAYALLPHAGTWREALTVRAGLEMNVPTRTLFAPRGRGGLDRSHSFFSVDAGNVIIETVKRAERSDALTVRLYEAHGSRARVVLRTSLPVRSFAETDLMEENPKRLRFRREGGGVEVQLSFGPFEIKTLVLALRGSARTVKRRR
ncbi:MAG: alpha-mannosidase [Planctomycetota bacterium]